MLTKEMITEDTIQPKSYQYHVIMLQQDIFNLLQHTNLSSYNNKCYSYYNIYHVIT